MKVRCPNHEDINPSMHVYAETSFCFVCGFTCKSEEVAGPEDLKLLKKEPTNIEEMMRYIDGCEVRRLRGLDFKADDYGYFIVWPDRSFYKKRLWEGKVRYMGPRGNKPPILSLPGSTQTLVLIEGEINALSLKESIQEEVTIASPGSATNMLDYMDFYLRYSEIYVIVDKDKPGVAWGWRLKQQLLKHGKKVHLEALEKDFNQVLQDGGKEAVKRLFYEKVGMLRGL